MLEPSTSWSQLRIAKSKFQSANASLQKTLTKEVETRLKNATFPDCSVIVSVESTAAEIETALEKFVEHKGPEDSNAKRRTQTAKEIVRKWFRASYPFTQVFLKIGGVTASAVFSSF